MKTRLRGVLPLAFCLVATGWSSAGWAQPLVAVFDVDGRGLQLSEPELQAAGDWLAARLEERLGVRTVKPAEMRAWLASQDLLFCPERGCQNDFERAVGAHYGVAMVGQALGRRCLYTASLYEAGSPATSRTASHRAGCRTEDVLTAVEVLVEALAAAGPLPQPKDSLSPPVLAAGGSGAPPGSLPPAEPDSGPDEIGTDSNSRLTTSVFWSPAPLIQVKREQQTRWEKTPDWYGLALGFETRLPYDMLLGIRVDFALQSGSFPLVIRALGGGDWPVLGPLSLFCMLELGWLAWFEAGDARSWLSNLSYQGFALGLLGGVRVKLLDNFGLLLEMGGGYSYAAAKATSGSTPDRVHLLQLHLGTGVFVSF